MRSTWRSITTKPPLPSAADTAVQEEEEESSPPAVEEGEAGMIEMTCDAVASGEEEEEYAID